MIGNLSMSFNKLVEDYRIPDGTLSFPDYITRCRSLIAERRIDLNNNPQADRIIEANSPFELKSKVPIPKAGVLLIHGLLDCPFSLKDIGLNLQNQGVLCRSILLPGHGTTPHDLLDVTYQDWIKAVRYGVRSLQNEVDHVFLIGYSTGAALSVYHALNDANIAGILLLAPAIRVKAPVDIVVAWHEFLKLFKKNKQWMYRHQEIDYVKYKSIGFNPIRQLAKLTDILADLKHQYNLACPVFMAVSREDETISSDSAMELFTHLPNQKNKLLLYTSSERIYSDQRIITRPTRNPSFSIKHFSHVSIPFAPTNSHYGENGDYIFASRLQNNTNKYIYGAYNRIEASSFDFLYRLGIIKQRRRELTFNPDFDFMIEMINKFVGENS